MALDLQHKQDFHQPQTADELRQLIQASRQSDAAAAFWLHDRGEPLLCLLTSGRRACLCYEPDLTWSRGPGNSNDDETVPFRLENGQVDDIAADTVIDVDTAIEVFIEFFDTGKLSTRIEWQWPANRPTP